jgi:hypothetical protein
LAAAQKRSGVLIHVVVFMSNHYHIVLTDPRGTLPIFTEELNKLIGRALNCHHDRRENFWSGSVQTNHLQLEGADAILDKAVYALANPTAAGLVSHGKKWPGVRLYEHGTYKARKPSFFFRAQEDGGMAERLDFELSPLPINASKRRINELVARAVSEKERELRAELRQTGRGFLGAAGAKRLSPSERPRASQSCRALIPRVACADRKRRAQILEFLAEFVRVYRERLRSYVAGERAVEFPLGTYRLVRQLGGRLAPG